MTQIEYARLLLKNLGYDEQDYSLERMSKAEISNLIDELKKELYG